MPEITFRAKDSTFRIGEEPGQLWQGTQSIKLQRKPWQVLRYLAERPQQVIGKEELRDNIWKKEGATVELDSVDQAVAQLRRWLGDDANDPRVIRAVPRKGLQFVGEIGNAPDDIIPSSGNDPTSTFRHDDPAVPETPEKAALADGDDMLELKFVYKDSNNTPHSGTYVTSWNHIFAVTGPYMLKPSQIWCSEAQLRTEIIGWLNKGEIKDYDFHLAEETRNSIKVQFMALGLIEISQTEHGHETWKLTPLGAKRLLSSEVARRRPAAQVATQYTDGDWITAAIVARERVESELKKLAVLAKRSAISNRLAEPDRTQLLSENICDHLHTRIQELLKKYKEGGTTDDTRVEGCIAKLVADILDNEMTEFLWRTDQRPEDDPILVVNEMIKSLPTRHG